MRTHSAAIKKAQKSTPADLFLPKMCLNNSVTQKTQSKLSSSHAKQSTTFKNASAATNAYSSAHTAPSNSNHSQPQSSLKRNVSAAAHANWFAHTTPYKSKASNSKTSSNATATPQNKSKQKKGPAVLAFVCQWSEFSALDNPNKAFEGKNVLSLEVPCFKSLDPVHVVNAFNCGFDGVMAVVCSQKTANYKKAETPQNAT